MSFQTFSQQYFPHDQDKTLAILGKNEKARAAIVFSGCLFLTSTAEIYIRHL